MSPRAHHRLRLAFLALGLAALPEWTARAGADPAALARFRQSIDDQLAARHASRESIDRDGLLRAIEAKLAAGEPATAIAAWLPHEWSRRWASFAPIDPPHAENPRFHLPFDRRVHWLVSQGVGGEQSHTGTQKYAFDFAMPEGTPILAAKGGIVARVTDGFVLCCRPKERDFEVNHVIILHRDGTFSLYAHLRKGVEVREGQVVEAGDRIGSSGSTGYATGPHLHFEVAIRTSAESGHSIPIRFRNGTPEGYVPKPWTLYENRPRASFGLRVSIDGSPLVSGKAFELANHDSVQLKVEAMSASGDTIDLTRRPGTQYVSLTPWSLRIDRMGRAHFDLRSQTWAFLRDSIERGVAIATIIVRDTEGKEGYFDVWFKFADITLPGADDPVER